MLFVNIANVRRVLFERPCGDTKRTEIEVEININQRTDFWIIQIETSAFNAANLYLLFLTGDRDVPITLNNKIAAFEQDNFLYLLQKLGFEFTADQMIEEIDLIYNPERVIRLIKDKSIDNKAVIINAINTLLDMLYALNVEMPKEYKTILYSLADHLTFNRSYGGFLKRENIDRGDIVNAFYWLNGILISNTKLNPTVFF